MNTLAIVDALAVDKEFMSIPMKYQTLVWDLVKEIDKGNNRLRILSGRLEEANEQLDQIRSIL